MNVTTNKSVIESTINGNTLTLAFSNGSQIVVDAATLAPEIRDAAMMHGLRQKLGDAAAISRDTTTGRAASVEDKFNAVKEVADRLVAGLWNKVREGGGGGNTGGLLLRALCEVYPRKTREELATWLEGKTAKEKMALRANEKIAALIASYNVGSVKGDDLLSELE